MARIVDSEPFERLARHEAECKAIGLTDEQTWMTFGSEHLRDKCNKVLAKADAIIALQTGEGADHG